ncbi:hypothetical protein BJV78DRAFT_1155148 [Lactifluus subvellereus]|nr:hypothetical protein BJV78DRAFT_1155148 [Lactifluus subvellereus]
MRQLYAYEEMRQNMTFGHRELLGVPIQSQVRLEEKVAGDGLSFTHLATGERAVLIYHHEEMRAELGSGDPGPWPPGRTHLSEACCPIQLYRHTMLHAVPALSLPSQAYTFASWASVFTHVPIAQPFANYLHLGGHPFTRVHVPFIARTFHVTAKAIHTLVKEYNKVRTKRGNKMLEVAKSVACLLPYSSF